MTTHIDHPDSHEHGLCPGCPRCEEHAAHPERSLDDENKKRLLLGRTFTELDEVAAARLKELMWLGLHLNQLHTDALEGPERRTAAS